MVRSDLVSEPLPSSLKLNEQLVHVAPAPVFAGLEGLDDGVVGRVEMFRGVLVLRVIAAADVAALQTEPEMDPLVAGGETFLAPAWCVWAMVARLTQMDAESLGHRPSLR